MYSLFVNDLLINIDFKSLALVTATFKFLEYNLWVHVYLTTINVYEYLQGIS